MQVDAAEVVPYALSFREPYVTARGRLEHREMALLRVRDEEGREGLGEAVPLSLRGGAGLETVVAELRAWAEEPVFFEPLEDPGLSAPAACAIRVAELDLSARQAGVPLWELLTFGAGRADPVPCNATLVAGEPEGVVEQALRWREDGFSTFKLKLGTGHDLATMRAVREALGPEPRLRADANGAWDLPEARALLAEMEPLGLELVEQPVATLDGMAALRETTAVLLAADESVATPADASRAFQLDACDFINLKLAKIGAADPAHFPEPIPLYLSSALDGPVGIAAAAHMVQLLRSEGSDAGVAHGLATQRLFAETIAARACELDGDLLHLPDGPGLGVEIDEAALERQRL